MDLVGYDEDAYNQVIKDFKSFATKLEVSDIRFIPISALYGDNVVDRSGNMSWYSGATLLDILETIHIGSDHNHVDCRFPVQTVIRPHNRAFHDYRGYVGRVAGGVFKPGDQVVVLPSGFDSIITSIEAADRSLETAFAPMSVTIRLKDDIDIGRGDMIVREHNQPRVSQDIHVMLCWLNNKDFRPGVKYALKHTTNHVWAIVKEVIYKMDINTLHRILDDKVIKMNDIARVRLRTTKHLFFDSYRRNRSTGSIILIDEGTNETVAAGMII